MEKITLTRHLTETPTSSSGGFSRKVLEESSHPLVHDVILSNIALFLGRDVERLCVLNKKVSFSYQSHVSKAKPYFDLSICLGHLRRRRASPSEEPLYSVSLEHLINRIDRLKSLYNLEPQQINKAEKVFLKETIKYLISPELAKQNPREAFQDLWSLYRQVSHSIENKHLEKDVISLRQEIVNLAFDLYVGKKTSPEENGVIVSLLNDILHEASIAINPRDQITPINYNSLSTQRSILHISQLLDCFLFITLDEEEHVNEIIPYLPLIMELLLKSSFSNSIYIQEARSRFSKIALYMFENMIDTNFDRLVYDNLDDLILLFTNISEESTSYNYISKKNFSELFSSIQDNDDDNSIIAIQENLPRIVKGFNPAPFNPSDIYFEGFQHVTDLVFDLDHKNLDTPARIQYKIDSLKEYISIICSPQMLEKSYLTKECFIAFLINFYKCRELDKQQKKVVMPLIPVISSGLESYLNSCKEGTADDLIKTLNPDRLFQLLKIIYDNLPIESRSSINNFKPFLKELSNFEHPLGIKQSIEYLLQGIDLNILMMSID